MRTDLPLREERGRAKIHLKRKEFQERKIFPILSAQRKRLLLSEGGEEETSFQKENFDGAGKPKKGTRSSPSLRSCGS
jgi:hypothetical protein